MASGLAEQSGLGSQPIYAKAMTQGLLLLLEEIVGVEEGGGEVGVVFDPGEEALAGHVAVVVAGEGQGGREALDGVVVVVLFDVFIRVLELDVAGLEGAAEREVGGGVEL